MCSSYNRKKKKKEALGCICFSSSKCKSVACYKSASYVSLVENICMNAGVYMIASSSIFSFFVSC